MPTPKSKSNNYVSYSLFDVTSDVFVLVFTVLAIIFSVYQSLPNQTSSAPTHTEWVNAIYNGAAVGIVIYLVTEKLASIIRRKRIAEQGRQSFSKIEDLLAESDVLVENRSQIIETLIAGEGRFVCLGYLNEAIERVTANISQATYVWNVYCSYGNVEDFNYSPKIAEMVVESIRDFLKKSGSRWIDLVSHPEDVSKRMKKVFSDKSLNGENYLCYKLEKVWPVLNFTILDFGGTRDRSVYFGFGRHPADEVGKVFYSTDKDIVDMFSKWHTTLRSPDVSCRLPKDFLYTQTDQPQSTVQNVNQGSRLSIAGLRSEADRVP